MSATAKVGGFFFFLGMGLRQFRRESEALNSLMEPCFAARLL